MKFSLLRILRWVDWSFFSIQCLKDLEIVLANNWGFLWENLKLMRQKIILICLYTVLLYLVYYFWFFLFWLSHLWFTNLALEMIWLNSLIRFILFMQFVFCLWIVLSVFMEICWKLWGNKNKVWISFFMYILALVSFFLSGSFMDLD